MIGIHDDASVVDRVDDVARFGQSHVRERVRRPHVDDRFALHAPSSTSIIVVVVIGGGVVVVVVIIIVVVAAADDVACRRRYASIALCFQTT